MPTPMQSYAYLKRIFDLSNPGASEWELEHASKQADKQVGLIQ